MSSSVLLPKRLPLRGCFIPCLFSSRSIFLSFHFSDLETLPFLTISFFSSFSFNFSSLSFFPFLCLFLPCPSWDFMRTRSSFCCWITSFFAAIWSRAIPSETSVWASWFTSKEISSRNSVARNNTESFKSFHQRNDLHPVLVKISLHEEEFRLDVLDQLFVGVFRIWNSRGRVCRFFRSLQIHWYGGRSRCFFFQSFQFGSDGSKFFFEFRYFG